jgi:hypothetical protein
MFLGHLLDLKAKAGGEKSMPEKRESSEGVYDAVLQGPRDRVKAILPESQSPVVEAVHSLLQRLHRSAPGADRPAFAIGSLRLAGRWRTTLFKGMSGTAMSRSTRSAPTERGIAYRTRVPRRRSLRSSPRTGEPSTWRRETGGLMTKMSRYARCETPKRSWESIRK